MTEGGLRGSKCQLRGPRLPPPLQSRYAYRTTGVSHYILPEAVKWGMGWVVVGTAVFGAPRFCIFLWKNAVFSRVLARNRGAPKTAVPTTTHPIPHLTPSEFFQRPEMHMSKDRSIRQLFVLCMLALGTLSPSATFLYSLGHPWKRKSCQMVFCPRQQFRGS